MDSRAKELLARGEKLFADRQTLVSRWQEIADMTYPERADFTTTHTPGDHYADNLITSYPILARRELGDAFPYMLRPREAEWFAFDDTNVDHAGQMWMESRASQMRSYMYDKTSQFVRATKEADHDFAGFGNMVISVDVAPVRRGLLYRCWHLRDVAWCDGVDGTQETVHRRWDTNGATLAATFPGRLHANLRQKMEKDPYCEVKCAHIVMPSRLYNDSGIRAPFVSVYIDVDHMHVMELVGTRTNPYVIARWSTVSGSQYGYSPAAVASLPDSRLLQSMTLSLLEAGEKAANPPMIAVTEAINSEINIRPGGVTWVDAAYDERMGEVLREISRDRSGMPLSMEMMQDIREQIRRGWYLDRFEVPIRGPEMTAYEFAQRVMQHVRQQLPLFEPMESSYNGGLCDRTFDVMMSQGWLGPPDDIPESLLGKNVEFKFKNPLRDSIEEQDAEKFMAASGVIERAAAADPTIAQLPNYEKAVRAVLKGQRIPAEWVHSEEEFEAIRKAAAKAAEMQQKMALMQQGSEVAKNVGATV